MPTPPEALEEIQLAEQNLAATLHLADFAKANPVPTDLKGHECVAINGVNYNGLAIVKALLAADDLTIQLFLEHSHLLACHNNLSGWLGSGAEWNGEETFFRALCNPYWKEGGEQLYRRAVTIKPKEAFNHGPRLLYKFGFYTTGDRSLKRYDHYIKTRTDYLEHLPESNPAPIDPAKEQIARAKILEKLGIAVPESEQAEYTFYSDPVDKQTFLDDELWNLFADDPEALLQLVPDNFIRNGLIEFDEKSKQRLYHLDRLPDLKTRLTKLFSELDSI